MEKQDFDEPVGQAKITKGYNLPSKYVVHTVGSALPPNTQPARKDCDLLASCYESCLKIADEYKLNSVAFYCISTGVFNFPQRKAAEIAIETVENTKTNVDKIIFDTFLDSDYQIYRTFRSINNG